MNESKNEKFRRLAIARTNRIAEHIRLLGNLSNEKTYAYSDKEVSQMFSYLENELKEARKQFSQNNGEYKQFDFQ